METENTVQVNGINILISDEVKPIASVKKVDYVKSSYGEGFVIAPKSGQPCC